MNRNGVIVLILILLVCGFFLFGGKKKADSPNVEYSNEKVSIVTVDEKVDSILTRTSENEANVICFVEPSGSFDCRCTRSSKAIASRVGGPVKHADRERVTGITKYCE